MGVVLRDIGAIFLCSFLFFYIGGMLLEGVEYYRFWLLPIFNGLYYGVPCSIIWVICVRIYKSNLLLFLSSWLTAAVLLYLSAESAKDGNAYLRLYGLEMYVNGEITIFGVFYKLTSNPLGVLSMYATLSILVSLFKKYKEKS